MGTKNRQRRAAKKRARAHQGRSGPQAGRTRAGASAGFGPPGDLGPPSAEELLHSAAYLDRVGENQNAEAMIDLLSTLPRTATAAAVERTLESALAALWDGGWQPADVHRMVRRERGADEELVLRATLAAESGRYESLGREVAPEWMAQLDAIGADRSSQRASLYLVELPVPWRRALAAATRLVSLFGVLVTIPELMPPPSQWRRGMSVADSSHLPAGLLDKVRALLAKAESTTFDAEAEAFTAKAQQLMARHRIDRALLSAAERDADSRPAGRRIGIDDPYAESKSILLAAVAEANGGQAVWAKGLGSSTVFAFPDELDIIEELFTSLLVQATAALRREGSKADGYGRSRTTRFRRSFLTAFGIRIGQRLREAVDDTIDETSPLERDAVLPVLATRDEAVREATERAFPDTKLYTSTVTDREGWVRGTAFADLADLGGNDMIEDRPAS